MSPNNIKSINKIKKETIEEFVNLIKEYMPLNICNSMEVCEKIDNIYGLFLSSLKTEPLTNADRIRSLSDEELAEFINNIAMDAIGTIRYGTQEYTEIWTSRKETIKYLKEEDKISKYRRYR